MKKDTTTTTVNGQRYDNATGMPIKEASGVGKRTVTSAKSLHNTVKRTATLRRPTVKKAAPSATTAQAGSDIIRPRKRPATTSATKATPHPSVKKFDASSTASVAAKPAKKATASGDIAPRKHPHTIKAALKKQPARRTATPSAKQTKEAEIAKALASIKKPTQPKKSAPKKSPTRRTKTIRWSVITAAIAIVAGAAIWINLPAISIHIASAQAGVDAKSPHFTPDGFTLRLPIEAKDNQVHLTYAAHAHDASFTLTQEKSAWDSQAVRTYVEQQSGGQFITTNDRGLTVYTFNGNAAWVNGGVLYQLASDSHLSSDTILRIASSL